MVWSDEAFRLSVVGTLMAGRCVRAAALDDLNDIQIQVSTCQVFA
jgi:hypothetical protein